jgi:uncharacterized glyoxalase superfamily protein PhnB
MIMATTSTSRFEPHWPVGRAPVPHRGRAEAAIRFYIAAFDAQGREAQALPAVGLRLYVPDVDATYERAVAAGAVGTGAPENRPYGSRDASIYDPFELTWWLAGPMT